MLGQKGRATVICDYLLSIIFLCGFIADQHKVPVMAAGTLQVVDQVRAVLQTGVSLSRKSKQAVFVRHSYVYNNTRPLQHNGK